MKHIKPPGTYVTGKRKMVYTVIEAAPYDVEPIVQMVPKPPPTITVRPIKYKYKPKVPKPLVQAIKNGARVHMPAPQIERPPEKPVPEEIEDTRTGAQRYLAMLGGEPKGVPKRPQVGKPNIMSFRKHRHIGVAGYSPALREELKREAEKNERKPRKHSWFSSVAEALKGQKKL